MSIADKTIFSGEAREAAFLQPRPLWRIGTKRVHIEAIKNDSC
jgi:hypothetical protein